MSEEKGRKEGGEGSGEKKDGGNLEWMYKGPTALVDREEYLLGRPVDKTFEMIQQAEKGVPTFSNSVEYDCTPTSIFASKGTEQVDLMRKIQEDPLLEIKKKEKESLKRILSNPVKMKHLKQMISQNSEEARKKEARMREKKKSSSEKDLDRLLAAKITNLKKKISGKDSRDDRPSSSSSSSQWKKPERPRMSKEEMERKRKEMMDNAKWRDEQRVKNVKHLTEEEKKEEEHHKKDLDPSFIRKQLSEAAAKGSIEGRIKSNRYNIQRSSSAMDKNFARR